MERKAQKKKPALQLKPAQPKPPHGPGRPPLLSFPHGPARPSLFPSPHGPALPARHAPRPLPGSTYQRQRAHTRSLSSARTAVAPSHRRLDPTRQRLHLPFPSSPPRNSAPDIPGELAGIHIPLHPAIPGALPLIGPPRTPPAPYSTR